MLLLQRLLLTMRWQRRMLLLPLPIMLMLLLLLLMLLPMLL